MGERTGFEPGTFCWTDLSTSDPEAARGFYTGLFGWETEDLPAAGDMGTYTLLRVDGRLVAALYKSPQGPPAWLSYVSVQDADASADRARELGGLVHVEPRDIPGSGRMAVIGDPAGAVFAVWQADNHFGAELVNDPGALTMNQLNTTDVEAAQAFYESLFGWRIELNPGEGGPDYWGIHLGERLNGGMMDLPPDAGAPSHWLAYFTVTDLDTSAEKIEGAGGRVLVAPLEIPAGRILVAQDPQGAHFALFEGEVDP
ncbi:MAG TPA: VOC family protein [Thermoleophilaceae bacterium]|nr:VOC family protein [Thermoleophilaceae bacterium]